MIEVQEQPELIAHSTAEDLHSALIRYHGRTVRFRSSREDAFYLTYNEYGSKRIELDVIGKLIGLVLNGSATWGRSEEPQKSRYSFILKIEGSDAFSVEHSTSKIEVLQEDSGLWKLIHRGSQWPEEEEKTEA